jgi:hypothetical protein
MSPSTSPDARQARDSASISSFLQTTAQKLAISRGTGRRVEGLLPDSISPKISQPAALWMREKEEALQLHLQRFGEVGR